MRLNRGKAVVGQTRPEPLPGPDRRHLGAGRFRRHPLLCAPGLRAPGRVEPHWGAWREAGRLSRMSTVWSKPPRVVALTGGALSREAGFAPFDPAAMPEGLSLEDVVSREGFARGPA